MFLCYGPELLLEPPQLIASTVRYERGIGGRNVTVNAHSSDDSSPALAPAAAYTPVDLGWYALLSEATKSLSQAVCIWIEGISVSYPSYRFLYCSLWLR